MGTAQRFFEVLDKPIERQGGKDFDISEADICINFKNITFSYSNGNLDSHKEEEKGYKAILKNLSFSIKKGSKLAMVGKSGCGKSTILKLILGLYDYSEGRIDFFGHDISEWSIQALRSQISYVSQDTYLFPTSVFDNILYGRTEATAEEVVSASKAAGAHEFIMELPDGYDTMVGERGIKLSGGQKQRISLARAFLKDAPLIVLDEPTSALDNISEAMVLDAMDTAMQNKTAIIVTHKLSAIKNVDEILVIDNGQIVERGTPEELMSYDSNYSRLYNKQFDNEN
jgi:ABC-type multidrug transport system fused ATPase/permease subunit